MSDFVSGFWSLYVAGITLASIVGCGVLLWMNQVKRKEGAAELKGHVWDETLEEYNNPLPRWWMWLFYITIIFSLVYLALYPGLGSFKGMLGWSQAKQYDDEVMQANVTYGPIFAKYTAMPVEKVAEDPKARAIGERLFLNYCASCHGSDARGSRGFPNLADSDWLWGNTPEAIKTSIAEGRNGVMPPLGAAVGSADDVRNLANYVLSLSGSANDSLKAALGKEKYVACVACHGADGKGNQQLGAPNLTDKIWLYGGGVDAIVEAINKGKDNRMPAHKDFLGDAKVHLLTAYVWSLSRNP
jgi:cytochrome c oxidase cbb3-type subunit 3